MAFPWLFRATNVLKHYRGFEVPQGERFQAYMTRLLDNAAVRGTCSDEALYLDSYARYAENRPNTSQASRLAGSESDGSLTNALPMLILLLTMSCRSRMRSTRARGSHECVV